MRQTSRATYWPRAVTTCCACRRNSSRSGGVLRRSAGATLDRRVASCCGPRKLAKATWTASRLPWAPIRRPIPAAPFARRGRGLSEVLGAVLGPSASGTASGAGTVSRWDSQEHRGGRVAREFRSGGAVLGSGIQGSGDQRLRCRAGVGREAGGSVFAGPAAGADVRRSRIFLLGAAGEQEENGLGASASGRRGTLTQNVPLGSRVEIGRAHVL